VPPLFVQTNGGRWAWKTDLSKTDAYWENWFTGMSAKFLGGKGAKLLILAGTDRLDKELMIGQMQGMFINWLVSLLFLTSLQANFNSQSSLPPVTSSKRISLRRLLRSSLSLSSAMTAARWCFLQRSQIFSRKARKSDADDLHNCSSKSEAYVTHRNNPFADTP
jgi:hypothetical protein